MENIEKYSIFNKYYVFLTYYLDRVEKFPRTSKFTLGDRILTILFDIQEILIEAIYSKRKREKLLTINILLEKLRIYTRLSSDKRYISLNQALYISRELQEIGKMIGGWLKTCKE